MKQCKLCDSTNKYSYFSLDLIPENEEDVPIAVTVCGSCWDVVAAIATKAMQSQIDDIKAQLRRMSWSLPE